MNRNILLVGIGGFLGSILRYLITTAFIHFLPSAFPLGTFIVNITGSLAIGIVIGLADRFDWLTPNWRVFLAIGFCGGFTTFSSFAYENIILLQDRDYLTFAGYAILSFTLCLAATFLGLFLTRG